MPHWKKSPARMSCIPPKGCSLPRRSRAICSSALNSSAEIMEISSRMSTCHAQPGPSHSGPQSLGDFVSELCI